MYKTKTFMEGGSGKNYSRKTFFKNKKNKTIDKRKWFCFLLHSRSSSQTYGNIDIKRFWNMSL